MSLDLAVQIVVASEAKTIVHLKQFFFPVIRFIERFGPDEVVLVNAVGSLPRDSELRRSVLLVCSRKLRFLTVVSPSAYVSPSALLGPGVQVNAGAIIQAGAQLEKTVLSIPARS